MGLLDWLTDISGASGGIDPTGMAMPPLQPQQQPTPADAPPAQQIPPAPSPAPLPQQAPPLPPPTTIAPAPQPADAMPMPQPRPPGAAVPPQSPMMAPPSSSPPSPDMPTAQPGNSQPNIPNNPGPGRGFLGQAFGMNSADEKNMKGALGAGLQSVGQNWNKPGLAAFAGSAGSAIAGGTAAEDKRIEQMQKLIQQKQKAGDDSSATLLAQVKLETAKMQLENLKAGNGKGTAWNKPPQQLYQDAMRLAQNDPDIKASEKKLEQIIKDGHPAEVQKAQADHAALVAAVRDKHLMGVGLSPQSAAVVEKTPGMTQTNPHPQNSYNPQNFESVVKPGQFYIDEKGQTRVRRQDGAKAVNNQATATAEPSTPASPSEAGDESD